MYALCSTLQVYTEIKDDVVNFFHDQGITIVTIQPEFKAKNDESKEIDSLKQCLISCQNLECAPKTCCSTTDLDTILIDGEKKKTKTGKYQKSKSSKKSSSLLSLNVMSLSKSRKLTGSAQDVIKKSVSETHVGQLTSDESSTSQNTSANVSNAPSETLNSNEIMHKSIEELKEQELDEETKSDEQMQEKKQTSKSVVSDCEDNNLLSDVQRLENVHTIRDAAIMEISNNANETTN